MEVCYCSMFCCTLLYVNFSFAIILMGKRELVALLSLSSWCLVIAVCIFLAVPWVCLQFMILVFPDHTHLLYLNAVYCRKILYYVVVKTQKMFNSHGGFLTCAMHHHRAETNLIKLTHYDETKKIAHGSQIVRAKKTHQIKPLWAKPKSSIKHRPTNESFTSGPSLSLRPDPLSCSLRRNHGIAINRDRLYNQTRP